MVLVAPWFAATMLAWIYTEIFEAEPEDSSQPQIGWIVAILQSASALVYLVYIPFALLCIGIVGRRSIFSFCCLVAGILVFSVTPAVAGGIILFTALSADDDEGDALRKEVGIAAGVTCLLSTVCCCFVLCWAMLCGSKGPGKHHQYPTPLAYFPFLRDFKEVRSERELDDSDKYTSDYPPPHHTFPERKPLNSSAWTKSK